jgi:small subunit ribosomal protein S17
MPKRVEIGVVTRDKTAKTRRVEIPRLVRHPKYGKTVRRRTICTVHDENNESHCGDTVEIIECRPRSRTKRWELVRIVRKADQVLQQVHDVETALEAATQGLPGAGTQ